MQQRKNDAEWVRDGRTKILKDTDEVQVTVPLREQVSEMLVSKLIELGEGARTRELWQLGNSERMDWLERQQELLQHYDEFISPIYDATQDWSSTLHLPIVLTVCKTYHARMLAALLSVDPPFTMKARSSANSDRTETVQEFVRYALLSWANRYCGIEEVADKWLWAWITKGRGILKNRWERSFTRYVDVVSGQRQVGAIAVPDQEGVLQVVPQMEDFEEEREVVVNTFDGPMIEFVRNEDVLILGGDGDPQEADHILHSTFMTASQLWSLVDQGVFRREAVEAVIEGGKDLFSTDQVSQLKEQQLASSGMGQLDKTTDEARYQIIERHSRIVINSSGIASDIIMWVHPQSSQVLRATYLYRVSKTGLRPFFAIDFHKRETGMPAGLPELLYSLAKEIDALENMKIDFGLISSMPFGFYRATSSLSEERMPLEPGALIPLDNPQTDVFFPNLGSRTGFTTQETQMLMNQIERLTSVSEMSLGVIGGQGAARTATGARALLGESNANLDVFLRRMNRGWKRMLIHFFHMLQERTPPGFQYRITGDDGASYWQTVKTKEELNGMYDFELEANSANSNKQVTIEQANNILQTIANPFFIQIGIVGPNNIFNALKHKFMVEGVRDWTKFINKPKGAMRIYSPEEIANSVLAGVDIQLGPEQDLQGFLDYFEYILKHDEILGQFNEQQTVLLAQKAQQAQQMMQAMQAQAAQAANAQQMQVNSAMAQAPQGGGPDFNPPAQQQTPVE